MNSFFLVGERDFILMGKWGKVTRMPPFFALMGN